MDDLFTQIEQARAAIGTRARVAPRFGLILGSGLGSLADELEDGVVVPYAEIPGFPRSTVHGHRGELALGRLAGQPVAVMRGRFHFYEGYSMQQVTFPVRVLRALGCTTLIVTNAAGGLRPEWAVGDLVLWDNVALHHGRPAFDRREARTLQRVALGNYTAVELVPNLAELLGR